MSQQINLYEDRLRPVHELVTGKRTALAFVFILVLVLAGAGGAQFAARQQEQNLAAQRAALKDEQDKLAALSKALAERRLPAALQGELEQARAMLTARRDTLAVLDSGRLGGTAGFAPVFAGFAHLASQELWLTGFTLSHGGSDIEIRGRMLDAARLPPYVQRLSAEPVFQGRRFAALNMQRVEADAAQAAPAPAGTGATSAQPAAAAPRFIDFVLRSERAGETPTAEGGRKPGFSNRELQDVLAGTKRKGKSKLFARFQRPSNHSR